MKTVFPSFSLLYFYTRTEICLAFVGKIIVNAPDNFTISIGMGRLHVCFYAVAAAGGGVGTVAGAATAAVALAVYVYGFDSDSDSDVWKPRLSHECSCAAAAAAVIIKYYIVFAWLVFLQCGVWLCEIYSPSSSFFLSHFIFSYLCLIQ